MYYLTYRPRTIAELDNSQVREKIATLLKKKQIPHALLFVGTKGMGKTSTARILAKSLNCLDNAFSGKPSDSEGKGDSIEPCNLCHNCLTIDTGSSPDVVEQDAASNRGIDEIRRLIKEASFLPMTGKYRVYIIDEAHMITTDAFNALLKTLEEPAKTVIFILATTNEEKIPETIVSRCVRIQFGKAEEKDILNMLSRIEKKEKLNLDKDLKILIATYSERSFRDAAKLLEELVMQDMLTLEKAKAYLGVRAKDSLLEIMQKSEIKEVLEWIEEFSANGGNIKRTIEDMLSSLKRQLLLKNNVIADEKDLGYSLKEVMILMKLLHEAYSQLRVSPIESLPLEIAVVEFYNLRK